MTFGHTQPRDWHRKSLSELFEIRAGGDIDWTRWRTVQDSEHPFPVYANGRADAGLHGYASYAMEKGDAITLTARGTPGELGFAFFRESAFTPIGRLLVLRSKGDADAVFFANYVNGVVRFAQENTGVAQLTAPQIARYYVDVPPLREQRAIATALSDVDGLLGGLDRLIAKKRDLKQAAMQQLLTGQTRLPGFTGEWEVSSIGREFEIKLGKMLDAEKNVGVLKPYLGNSAVQWNQIDISNLPTVRMSRADIERFRLRKGDLLVCEGGEVGRAAIWDAPLDECYYQKALHRLRPLRGYNSRLMASFLQLWSDQGLLANYVTQTSIAHLPREKFIEIPLAVPSPPEQTAIAEVLSDMDGGLAGLEQRREKTRALKQAMMQELLTGRTRLL
jgi:restriction endonuclease S subunit